MSITAHRWSCAVLAVLLCAGCARMRVSPKFSDAESQGSGVPVWRFAVAGDSRDCGDVVMPAIAQSALRNRAQFYWHLGDFRKMSDIDEDMRQQYGALTSAEYRRVAWDDFLAEQIAPFDPIPVYLGIGNHELYKERDPDGSRTDYMTEFAHWLDAPAIHAQRLRDDPTDAAAHPYYHWRQGNVDFVYLDNASDNGFAPAQLEWFERVLARDKADADIRAVVVGMHRALPNSLACGHSMNGDKDHENQDSIDSGRRVYRDLLQWRRDAGKRVYVLASHSHVFMDGVFGTPYWNSRGVLPGWIIGTAGARRYPLPEDLPRTVHAQTFVYGYLLATVSASGDIEFAFQQLNEADVPAAVTSRFGQAFVEQCFRENSDRGKPAPPPASCLEQ